MANKLSVLIKKEKQVSCFIFQHLLKIDRGITGGYLSYWHEFNHRYISGKTASNNRNTAPPGLFVKNKTPASVPTLQSFSSNDHTARPVICLTLALKNLTNTAER